MQFCVKGNSGDAPLSLLNKFRQRGRACRCQGGQWRGRSCKPAWEVLFGRLWGSCCQQSLNRSLIKVTGDGPVAIEIKKFLSLASDGRSLPPAEGAGSFDLVIATDDQPASFDCRYLMRVRGDAVQLEKAPNWGFCFDPAARETEGQLEEVKACVADFDEDHWMREKSPGAIRLVRFDTDRAYRVHPFRRASDTIVASFVCIEACKILARHGRPFFSRSSPAAG